MEQHRRAMAAVERVAADFEKQMVPIRAVQMAVADQVARYFESLGR
jgi:hypothetical protein